MADGRTMHLRSLGFRTDLIFPTFDGRIVDRGDYLVVWTPSNPTFYWGNFLVFQEAPVEGDLVRWRRLFAEEIGEPLQASHETFGWDSPESSVGLVEPFLEVGFSLVKSRVLRTSKLRPPVRVATTHVRRLETDADWDLALDLQVLCREAEHDEAGYRTYCIRQMERYRAMVAAGRGHWYGAFQDESLLADLGLFHLDGLGRFQSVETHPDFRRRGLAGTLVYEAGTMALAEGLSDLVIVADAGSPAEGLYTSVGFEPVEFQMGLERWPRAAVDPSP